MRVKGTESVILSDTPCKDEKTTSPTIHPIATLVLISRTTKWKQVYIYILEIQNNFVPLNSSSINGVLSKTYNISILRAIYFIFTSSETI